MSQGPEKPDIEGIVKLPEAKTRDLVLSQLLLMLTLQPLARLWSGHSQEGALTKVQFSSHFLNQDQALHGTEEGSLEAQSLDTWHFSGTLYSQELFSVV